MLMKEWVIVPARGGMGYCPLVEEWITVPPGYAHKGVGYCARSWRSGLLCLLVEVWVFVPAREEWVIVPARGGVGGLCAWMSVTLPAGYARGGVGYARRGEGYCARS